MGNPGTDAFDDHGRLTASTGFVDPFADESAEPEDSAEWARRATLNLLLVICNETDNDLALGRMVRVLAWHAGVHRSKHTAAALAKEMGISPARVSQILSNLTRFQRENRKAA